MSEKEQEQQDDTKYRETTEHYITLIVLDSEENQRQFDFPLKNPPPSDPGVIPKKVSLILAEKEHEEGTQFFIKTSIAKTIKNREEISAYGTTENKVNTHVEMVTTHYEAQLISMEDFVEMANEFDKEDDEFYATNNQAIAEEAFMMGQSFYQLPDGAMYTAFHNGLSYMHETTTRQNMEQKDMLTGEITTGTAILFEREKMVLVTKPALENRPLRDYIMTPSGDTSITHLGSPKPH